MKSSAVVIASLLAAMLSGCGDGKRISELEGQLKRAQDNISEISNSLQNVTFAAGFLNEIHGSKSYEMFQAKQNIAGYELARETLAGQNIVAARIRGEGKISNPTQQIIAPLYWLEDRWPDRLSKEGIAINEGLWWCRDSVTTTRLAMEAMSSMQQTDAERFMMASRNAITKCGVALQAIK